MEGGGVKWLEPRLRQFILELALISKMVPDLNHSPTAGDQWGGDTRHAVTSQLEIIPPILCLNDMQVESEVGNVLSRRIDGSDNYKAGFYWLHWKH